MAIVHIQNNICFQGFSVINNDDKKNSRVCYIFYFFFSFNIVFFLVPNLSTYSFFLSMCAFVFSDWSLLGSKLFFSISFLFQQLFQLTILIHTNTHNKHQQATISISNSSSRFLVKWSYSLLILYIYVYQYYRIMSGLIFFLF